MNCFRDEEKQTSLTEQFSEMFKEREWIMFKKQHDAFSFSLDGVDELIQDAEGLSRVIVNVREQGISIPKTDYNLVFFFDARQLSKEKAFSNDVVSFCKRAKLLLSGINTHLDCYFHVCKDMQEGSENLECFDDFLEKVEDARLGNVFLIDKLHYERSVKSWLRASTRLMHILALDDGIGVLDYSTGQQNIKSLLKNSMNDPVTPAVLVNCFMTELDEQDVEKKQAEEQKLLNLLQEEAPPFPDDILRKNYDNLLNEELIRYSNRFTLDANSFPIPADMFGCFKRRQEIEDRLAELGSALKETIRVHIETAILKPIDEQEKTRYAERIKNGISERSLESISDHLEVILHDYECGDSSFVPTLPYCRKETELLEQISAQLDEARDSVSGIVRNRVNKDLFEVVRSFHNAVLTDKERIEYQRALERLQPIMRPEDYLRCIAEAARDLPNDHSIRYAIYAPNWRRKISLLLISNAVAKKWNGVLPEVIANDTGLQVFNYQDLQEYEYQALSIVMWDKDRYEQYKKQMFRLLDK